MDSIIHNAVKGIGPSAMRETIVSLHELEWQKKGKQLGYAYYQRFE